MSIRVACSVVMFMIAVAPALSSELEHAAKAGYGVLYETTVPGAFEGCDFNRRVVFDNGLFLVCSSYSYHYAYRPDVLILKSVRTGAIKILIDDEEFEGTVYKPGAAGK